MTLQEYMKALGAMPGSRKNEIIHAVNCRLSKKEAGLKTAAEEMFFERMTAEADAYEKRGGVRPVFETVEIESDDKRLEIYN